MIHLADFALSERPIRDFELVNDVLKAWNPEKRVNVLIIRRSPMCGLLKPEVSLSYCVA
jgi:hypothetical protein